MVTRILITVLAAVFLTGCSTLPEQYAASPTRSLIKGVSTSNTEVKIRNVDGGDVIWRGGMNLGDKIWLEPGVHKIGVMCTSKHSSGSYIQPGEVEIDVKPGYDYFLSTDPVLVDPSEFIKSPPRKATVHVAPIARKR